MSINAVYSTRCSPNTNKFQLLRNYERRISINSITHKMFYKMVNDFDDASLTNTGCAYIIPARIAYHIVGGVNFYIEMKLMKIVIRKRND